MSRALSPCVCYVHMVFYLFRIDHAVLCCDTSSGDTWDPNRELISSGIANLFVGVFGGFAVGALPDRGWKPNSCACAFSLGGSPHAKADLLPECPCARHPAVRSASAAGSVSRTSLSRLAGARTKTAHAVTGLVVLAALPICGAIMVYLPKAVLGELIHPRIARSHTALNMSLRRCWFSFSLCTWLTMWVPNHAGGLLCCAAYPLLKPANALYVRFDLPRPADVAFRDRVLCRPSTACFLRWSLTFFSAAVHMIKSRCRSRPCRRGGAPGPSSSAGSLAHSP